MNQIAAIETVFDGYRFRSRTEARWAVFFHNMRWSYEYEKEGFHLNGTRYLPDFFLPQLQLWWECKGVDPSMAELHLMAALAFQSKVDGIISIGAPKVLEHQLIVFPFVLVEKWYDHAVNAPYISLNWKMSPIKHQLNISTRGDLCVFPGGCGSGYSLDVGSGLEKTTAQKLSDAFFAASSARFEHGEMPARLA